MKRRKANQKSDIHRHEVAFAPARGLQTGITYRARIAEVVLRKGKLVFRWSIYRGSAA